MNDEIIKLGKVFKSLSYVFGLVPGLAVLILGIGIFNNEKYLFGGVLEALSCIVLLIFLVNKKSKLKLIEKKGNTLVIILILISLSSIFLYSILYNNYVVRGTRYETAVHYPIWLSAEFKEIAIKDCGNNKVNKNCRVLLIDEFGPAGVEYLINTTSSNFLTITVMIFLILYLLIFIPLVSIFVFLGSKLTEGKIDNV